MAHHQLYTAEYYKTFEDHTMKTARVIVPIVLKLIEPKSVVDVGCGSGNFLAVFKEEGVSDILGIDGEWIDPEMLQIPKEKFISVDFTKPFPMNLNRQFDLVLCLEVAEHIDSKYADPFIDLLTRLGPIVLFSAAIPFQNKGEDRYHVNEQWPEYWVKRFEERGYAVIDCIRKKVWNNGEVAYYYAQNALLFAKPDLIMNNPSLKLEFERSAHSMLSVVHPVQYSRLVSDQLELEKKKNYISVCLRKICSFFKTS